MSRKTSFGSYATFSIWIDCEVGSLCFAGEADSDFAELIFGYSLLRGWPRHVGTAVVWTAEQLVVVIALAEPDVPAPAEPDGLDLAVPAELDPVGIFAVLFSRRPVATVEPLFERVPVGLGEPLVHVVVSMECFAFASCRSCCLNQRCVSVAFVAGCAEPVPERGGHCPVASDATYPAGPAEPDPDEIFGVLFLRRPVATVEPLFEPVPERGVYLPVGLDVPGPPENGVFGRFEFDALDLVELLCALNLDHFAGVPMVADPQGVPLPVEHHVSTDRDVLLHSYAAYSDPSPPRKCRIPGYRLSNLSSSTIGIHCNPTRRFPCPSQLLLIALARW